MEPLRGDQVDRWVAADPATVYRLVSDVIRTPQWSPEVIDCHWLDDSQAGRVGARFRARNRRRWFTWSNTPVVDVADPPREFAVTRTEPGGGTIRWSHRLAPEGDGTRVVHAFEVLAPVPTGLQWVLRVVFGVRDLQADLRTNMTSSLERLAAVADDERTGRAGTPPTRPPRTTGQG